MDRDEALKRSKNEQELPLLCTRPTIEGYDFFDYFQSVPSGERVGSRDYYDYILLTDGRLVVVVADVCGFAMAKKKLFVAKIPGEVRLCLKSESNPAQVVTHLNKRACQLNLNQLMTFLMVILDPNSHEAAIVNAGHAPPIHRQLDGSLSLPGEEAACIPIGVMEQAEYIATTVTLQPGESLTLFTDGLFEAPNSAGEQFTFDRVCEIVAATNGNPSEIGNSLLTQVRQHLGDQPQDDDMCLISFGPVPTAQVPHKGT